MGSIPASLVLIKHKLFNDKSSKFSKLRIESTLLRWRFFCKGRLLRPQTINNSKVKYTLSFRSLFPFSLPSVLFSVNHLNSSPWLGRKTRFERLMVKNSYLLFTWFYYINATFTLGQEFNSEEVPSFFTKPKKVSMFTITKAPMAHKTFSQEQYKIKYYSLQKYI